MVFVHYTPPENYEVGSVKGEYLLLMRQCDNANADGDEWNSGTVAKIAKTKIDSYNERAIAAA